MAYEIIHHKPIEKLLSMIHGRPNDWDSLDNKQRCDWLRQRAPNWTVRPGLDGQTFTLGDFGKIIEIVVERLTARPPGTYGFTAANINSTVQPNATPQDIRPVEPEPKKAKKKRKRKAKGIQPQTEEKPTMPPKPSSEPKQLVAKAPIPAHTVPSNIVEGKRVFIGSIPFHTTEWDLMALFQGYK